MPKSNIIKALEELDKKDIYSLLLELLIRMKGDPKYSTLGELAYILDNENFIKFLNYFGGQTITVPTVKQLSGVLAAITVYVYQQDGDKPLPEVMKEVGVAPRDRDEVLEVLNLIPQLVTNYDFKRNAE